MGSLVVISVVLSIVALAMIGSFVLGYKKCLARTQKTGLSVFVGFACAFGSLMVLVGLAFGACVCAMGTGKM